jgi:hypothetical protein
LWLNQWDICDWSSGMTESYHDEMGYEHLWAVESFFSVIK